MADTPNNELEKRLRDYAQERRTAAGSPEMHPATRQMLQAEVKQQLGHTTTSSRPAGWLRFWPRLAFAFGIIVIAGFTTIVMLPHGGTEKAPFVVAKAELPAAPEPVTRESSAAPVPLAAPAAAPVADMAVAPAAAPATGMAARLASDSDTSARRTDSLAATEPARAMKAASPREATKPGTVASKAGARSAGQVNEESMKFADSTKAKDVSATALAGAATTSASSSVQAKGAAPTFDKAFKSATPVLAAKTSDGNEGLNDAVRFQPVGQVQTETGQRYRNIVTLKDRKQTATSAVLDEFTVTQDGEALTIVDRDGSVYNGYARLAPADRQAAGNDASGAMQLVPNAANGGRAAATLNQQTLNNSVDLNRSQQSQTLRAEQNATAQNFAVQNASANYFFRVEGTNRSLKERVVFSGNLLQTAGSFNTYNAYNANVGNVSNVQNVQAAQQRVAPESQSFNFNNTFNAPLQNNFINGRVQLGSQQATELNALPVER